MAELVVRSQGLRELEARGVTLRSDEDADLELRSGRSFRVERDMFGGDPLDPEDSGSPSHRTFLYLERALLSPRQGQGRLGAAPVGVVQGGGETA